MNLSAVRKWMIGLLIGCLAVGALAFLLSKDPDLTEICAVLVILDLVLLVGLCITRWFWKCPHCKSLLPWREGGADIVYCPYCGEDVGND